MKTGEVYLLDGCRVWLCGLVATGFVGVQRGEPMSDLISREQAIDLWDKLSKRGRTEFDQVLMTLPSADRPTGEWVNDGDYVPQCSECGYVPRYIKIFNKFDRSDWCPNCGARMKGADDEMR